MNAVRPPRALLGSTFSDRQVGGITRLAAETARVTAKSHATTWIARIDQAEGSPTDYGLGSQETRRAIKGVELRVIQPGRGTRPLLDRVGWTIFQPGGETLAPAVFRAAHRASLARQLPPDVSLVHWIGTGIELMGHALARHAARCAAPFLVTPALHEGQWGDAAIDARLYRRADHVIVLSARERRRVESLGVLPSTVTQVAIGPTIDLKGDEEAFWRRHGLDRRLPIVSFVGRRSAYKGLLETIEASAALRSEGLDHVLAVAGPRGDLEVPAAAGTLDLGLCSEEEKADLFAASSVLCVPSISESYGIVYVDAWSVGVPVIASRGPAVAPLVRDGEDGLIVDQNPASVGAALRRLLEDPELAARLGATGRERQMRELSWERFAKDHETAAEVARETLRSRVR